MDESEQALWSTAEKNAGSESRIARQILNDSRTRGLWEARHAELMRPVAERKSRVPQIMAMRAVEVRLTHRHALIDYIREKGLKGAERERLFRVFYGPRELQDAVLAEHRQYMLAISSRVSTDHLIDLMQDPQSLRLLRQYRASYARYFELYCYVVGTEDPASAAAARDLMVEERKAAERVRQLIGRRRPEGGLGGAADFERQAALARSGRHEALNYLGS